jgi:2-polyprenyl-3-methyl-5-hydroxy-6-metoxy-1,4-benzoquinol methylase
MPDQQPARYVYPDEGDRLTQLLIEETGRAQAWNDEEQAVLLDLAHRVLEVKPPRSVLDVGAGLGRVMVQMLPYFRSGDLIEPDQIRRDGLTEIMSLLDPKQARFQIHTGTDKLDAYTMYNVILLSHVIQHISQDDAQNLLASLVPRIKSGGFLYLATCLSSTTSHEYAVTRFDGDGEFEEISITSGDFAELIRSPQDRKLPIHFFPIGALSEMVKSVGLSVVNVQSFHLVKRPGSQRMSFRDVALIAKVL